MFSIAFVSLSKIVWCVLYVSHYVYQFVHLRFDTHCREEQCIIPHFTHIYMLCKAVCSRIMQKAYNQHLTAIYARLMKLRLNECGATQPSFLNGNLVMQLLQLFSGLVFPKFDSAHDLEAEIGVQSILLVCPKHYSSLYRQLHGSEPAVV